MYDIIRSFRLPRWRDQDTYVEIYCEKEALSGILSPIANKYHCYFGANKGYSSASTMYELGQRIKEQIYKGKKVILIYLGDHDPSGLDMVRDITDRIFEFLVGGDNPLDVYIVEERFEVDAIALNMEQVKQYNPPPNPAKIKDPRANRYIEKFGNVSWELDALKPEVLTKLLETGIQSHMDVDKYNAWILKERPLKQKLRDFADSLINGHEKEPEGEGTGQ